MDVLCIDKTGTLTRPGMRLATTELLDSQPAAAIEQVIAAVTAADREPDATMRAIATRYDHPPGWTVRERVPFSSARKWSGVSFTGHGNWLLGAPATAAGSLSPPLGHPGRAA